MISFDPIAWGKQTPRVLLLLSLSTFLSRLQVHASAPVPRLVKSQSPEPPFFSGAEQEEKRVGHCPISTWPPRGLPRPWARRPRRPGGPSELRGRDRPGGGLATPPPGSRGPRRRLWGFRFILEVAWPAPPVLPAGSVHPSTGVFTVSHRPSHSSPSPTLSNGAAGPTPEKAPNLPSLLDIFPNWRWRREEAQNCENNTAFSHADHKESLPPRAPRYLDLRHKLACRPGTE